VNKDRFLTDETGNRRFLVVEVADIQHGHAVDMTACWAEALYLYRSGYQYWFDRSEIHAVNERNEDHRVRSLAEELVTQYCVKPDEQDETAFYTSDNFMTASAVAKRLQETYKVNVTVNSYFISDIGRALTSNGFEKHAKKINGFSQRGYYVKIIADSENSSNDKF
jgi:predicted P-loop ATPase